MSVVAVTVVVQVTLAEPSGDSSGWGEAIEVHGWRERGGGGVSWVGKWGGGGIKI